MGDGLEGIGTGNSQDHVPAGAWDENERYHQSTYAGSRDHTDYERARVADMRAALDTLEGAQTYDPATAVRAVGDLLTAASMVLEMGSDNTFTDEASQWLGLSLDIHETDPASVLWQHLFAVRDAGHRASDYWTRHQEAENNYFIAYDAYAPGFAQPLLVAAQECRGVIRP